MAAAGTNFDELDRCVYLNRGQSLPVIEKHFGQLFPNRRVNIPQMLEAGVAAGRYTTYVGTNDVQMWKRTENVEPAVGGGAQEEDDEEVEEEEDDVEELQNDDKEEGEQQGGPQVVAPTLDLTDHLDLYINDYVLPRFVASSANQAIRAVAISNVTMRKGKPVILRFFFAGGKGSGKTWTATKMAEAFMIKYYPERIEGEAPFSEEQLKRCLFSDTLASLKTVKKLKEVLTSHRAIVLDECDIAVKRAKDEPEIFQMLLALMQWLGDEKVEQTTMIILVGYQATFQEFVRFDEGYARRFCLAEQIKLEVLPAVVAKSCMKFLSESELTLAAGISAESLMANPEFVAIAASMPYLAGALEKQLIGYDGVMSMADVIQAVKQIYEFEQRVLKKD